MKEIHSLTFSSTSSFGMPKAKQKKLKAITAITAITHGAAPPPYYGKESHSSSATANIYIKPLFGNKLCIVYIATLTDNGMFKPPGEGCDEIGQPGFSRHVHKCHACHTMIEEMLTKKKKGPKNASFALLPDHQSRNHHYLDSNPIVISTKLLNPTYSSEASSVLPDPSEISSPPPDPSKTSSSPPDPFSPQLDHITEAVSPDLTSEELQFTAQPWASRSVTPCSDELLSRKQKRILDGMDLAPRVAPPGRSETPSKCGSETASRLRALEEGISEMKRMQSAILSELKKNDRT
ncbi:hypothetical protein BCR41DRAFT_419125 [Lobosporangium transversale]|uniref:Uncharacterized protein n=1 Tax=Lobosporangium transversale TaxID=64571 RepID=A0A1Y2GYG6_9FUNG|nr:hypothetical protein BCR41DRAFT_419125 [Lobosporangium transversale]ORZ27317.1 hypothetical protein BCR41DRAFT_419125 [Lobosporangium transversale]|eukprot:XP_021885044.1 hypothetical protein BCR41DRAFT_419125 [Lobosporangium transversale]